VTRWNSIAIELLAADPGFIAGSRAAAIMHAAIHDAVNGIRRRYASYTIDLSSSGASLEAAVTSASREVILSLSPQSHGPVESEYQAWLTETPDGPARQSGIALGRESAQANLARRARDLSSNPLELLAEWGRVAPFAIDLGMHGLRGPDPVQSIEYALDFNYVKSVGKFESQLRTDEQKEIAFFWFESPTVCWNRLATMLVRQLDVDVWRSARILALVNFALADGYIAGFDAKYRFRSYRPYIAIRNADDDGNPHTNADPSWQPLFSTDRFRVLPVPEYPSTHSVVGAAAAEVLIDNFGNRCRFQASSASLPGVTRKFESFTQAAMESGLSGVYGGIHFLHAIGDGYRQGKGIGQAVSRLLPEVGATLHHAEGNA
jgi:hypothetical protein